MMALMALLNLQKNELKFTHSPINEGLCVGMNKASKLSSFNYILYAHDDMYFLPKMGFIFNRRNKKTKN